MRLWNILKLKTTIKMTKKLRKLKQDHRKVKEMKRFCMFAQIQI